MSEASTEFTAAALLDNEVVRAALKKAWLDSAPGVTGGHEEGGFITRDEAGTVSVARWLRGSRDEIFVPAHDRCRVEGADILASFHTHPNTGPDYQQEPSATDRAAVREDPT